MGKLASVDDPVFSQPNEPIPLKGRRQARTPPSASTGDWQDAYARDDRGQPYANTSNAEIALRNAPEFQGAFAFDERASACMLTRPLPGMKAEGFSTRPLSDTDTSLAQIHVQRNCGLPRIGKDAISDGIDLVAHEASFDPFRDELDHLVWDGVKRLDTWFISHAGAADTPYVRAIGPKMLISLIARTYQPGCKVDHVPILIGAQGAGKSTTLRVLGGRHFSDSLPESLTGKDASQHLLGRTIVEIAELNQMSKATAAELKAFTTRQEERFRPPYGRREVIQPRRCILVGTTNSDAFLRDETGGRRFWPVKLGRIDLAALTQDRDQLLAEAVVQYRNGVPWWPSREEEAELFAPEQEARFESDVWEDDVREYLIGKSSVLVRDIAADSLGFSSISRVDTRDRNRITAILRRLGWAASKKKDWKGNKPFRPIDADTSDVDES